MQLIAFALRTCLPALPETFVPRVFPMRGREEIEPTVERVIFYESPAPLTSPQRSMTPADDSTSATSTATGVACATPSSPRPRPVGSLDLTPDRPLGSKSLTDTRPRRVVL
jgi:hypothetical protein